MVKVITRDLGNIAVLVATMNRDTERHYLAIFDRFFGEVVDSETILSYLALGSDIPQGL